VAWLTDIDIEGAIIAAAGADNIRVRAAVKGAHDVKEWLDQIGAFATPERLAHMVGQCAHESMGFTVTEERLSYSASRLMQVWPSRYPTMAVAEQYARNPRKLANHTYGGRNGNIEPDDGWKYRGRGWLQLTGRDNYKRTGAALGIDLECRPELAEDSATAWKIAAYYLDNHRREGKTAFEWADLRRADMVTRIVNGGVNGLDDRIRRTTLALAVLKGNST